MKGCINYPNPFHDRTTIQYSIPRNSKVGLDIFDSTGKLVFRLYSHAQLAGQKAIPWNGKDMHGNRLPEGSYYYIVRVDNSYELSNEMFLCSEEVPGPGGKNSFPVNKPVPATE